MSDGKVCLMNTAPPHPEPLEPDRLTWAVMLARWTDFARSAVALPEDDGEAGRVRRSVADIITLQAVWFCLQHLDELDPAERTLGLDRAAVLVDRHIGAIRGRFDGLTLPGGLEELIQDVHAALEAVKSNNI